MAPTNTRAVASVISTQVVTQDEKSILVEAGGFTPMRWFLERGAHHYQDAEKDGEEYQQPPRKRVRISRPAKSQPSVQSPPNTIPLSRVTIDLHFPETLAMKTPRQEKIGRAHV